jgi:twitching motility protein PilI
MSAENVLQVMNKLSQCFVAGSRPLPAQVDYAPLIPVISFALLGHDWAVPLEEVSELVDIQDCTPLPGVKPWVVGVSNLRGKLLPVIDFAQFLGGRLCAAKRLQRIVVLYRQDVFIGLIVDELKGMRHFSSDADEPNNQPVDAALKPFVQGCYRGNGGTQTWLFSPDALIANQSFHDVTLT